MENLHYIQTAILLELATNKDMRFSDFTVPQELKLEKDSFNYHLQTLVKLKLIDKSDDNNYSLSNKGKQHIGELDFINKREEKMPKISVMVQILNRDNPNLCLVCKRLKHPFFHQLGFVTGKVKIGELFAEAMVRESQEETGLTPTKYELLGIQRWIDFNSVAAEPVHDGVFVMFRVTDYQGELNAITMESENTWMDITQLIGRDDILPSTDKFANGTLGDPRPLLFAEGKIILSNF